MAQEKNDTHEKSESEMKPARLYLLLSLLWMAVIFAFSSQAYSGRITEAYLHSANIPVRKLGHVSEFAILSLLYCKTFGYYLPAKLTKAKPLMSPGLALVMALAYACLDEWHQAFVPGRSSSATDVLVDTIGIVIALGTTLVVTWRRRKKDPSAPLP